MSIINFIRQIASKRKALEAQNETLKQINQDTKKEINRVNSENGKLKQQIANLKARNLSLQAQVQMMEGKLHKERNERGQFAPKK